MLDLRYVTENLDEVRAQIARRSDKYAPLLDEVAKLAVERRAALTELERLRAVRNEASAAMAKLDKKSAEFTQKRDELKASGDRAKELEAARQGARGRARGRSCSVCRTCPTLRHPTAPTSTRTWS
jgi:seryl-tRNA synthetase